MKEVPEERKEELKEMLEARDSYHNIKAFADTPGGKELVDSLLEKIVSIIRLLARSESDPLCAKLDAHLDMLMALVGAEANQKDMDNMLKEALSTTE